MDPQETPAARVLFLSRGFGVPNFGPCHDFWYSINMTHFVCSAAGERRDPR